MAMEGTLRGADASSITEADFRWLADTVREDAGVQLDISRLTLAEARLMPLVRERGLDGYAGLFDAARGGDAALRRKMVESLLTGETLFFRDLHPFEALRAKVLPGLIERRARTRRLRLWSAAASTVQEAYSMAILLREQFPQLASWQVSILATDFNQASLERAREGLFSSLEANRGLGAATLTRHFRQEGSRWRVDPAIAQAVHFAFQDLTRPWPLREPFDVIFLRNVLIYFDDPTKRRILKWAAQALAPDGSLFLGSAETTLNLVEGLRRVDLSNACCYQRTQS
jgi:chemotaxis protein methyltransferase CheR